MIKLKNIIEEARRALDLYAVLYNRVSGHIIAVLSMLDYEKKQSVIGQQLEKHKNLGIYYPQVSAGGPLFFPREDNKNDHLKSQVNSYLRHYISSEMNNTVVNESPQISRQGKKVMGGDIPLKDLTVADISENVITFVADKPGPLWHKGLFLSYFMDSAQSVQDMKNDKIPYIFVHDRPRLSFNMAPIRDVWKWNKEPGQEHILAVAQGTLTDKEIYVDKMTVRPGYKRNTIATKILTNLQNDHPNLPMNFSGPTEAGFNFIKKLTGKKWEPKHGEHKEF